MRRARLARLGAALVGTAAGLALAYVLVVYVGSALLRGLAAALALLPRAFVCSCWRADGADSGRSPGAWRPVWHALSTTTSRSLIALD